ncbi:hypothetical protein CANINC_003019 [Pichia inconspicua]|uniref:Uncharacterized protein n=1 Tax=Pichia inconspicua TaxID=52247 RepID=A0A4T0WZN3_9ASCO|nr:hypothetical protein CANINC_003019 [[Candida] inconspicua]
MSATLRSLQVRSFSSSKVSNSVLDYFKFFKKKATKEQGPTVKETKEVIEEVKEKQDEIASKTNIEILGVKNPRYTDPKIIEKNLKGFKIHRWIPKSNELSMSLTQENYKSEINKALSNIFSEGPDFNNLYTRFKIFKQVQQTFIISIPDSQFALLKDQQSYERYLLEHLNPALKLSNKTVFTPDAVDFAPGQFEGTNVFTTKHVFNTEKEKKFKKLLQKASKLQKQSLQEYIEKRPTA